MYIKSKVVGPFSGPYASRSYMHRAALFMHKFIAEHIDLNDRFPS
jgi:hypothetical protein